jgi:hypothetical protein
LLGNGAGALGLEKEGVNYVAIPAFLAACALWFGAHRILKEHGWVVRTAAFALLILWFFTLCFAAVVGGSYVYSTPFFIVAMPATAFLLAFAALVEAKGRPSGR